MDLRYLKRSGKASAFVLLFEQEIKRGKSEKKKGLLLGIFQFQASEVFQELQFWSTRLTLTERAQVRKARTHAIYHLAEQCISQLLYIFQLDTSPLPPPAPVAELLFKQLCYYGSRSLGVPVP